MRFGGGSALASGFKEHDGSGGGYVEGADAAGHWNVQQMIAGAANEIVESRAFTAEHDDEIAGEVELVVSCQAALSNSRVQADDPEVVFLQLLKGADEVDNACDAKVLGGPGAGLHSGGAQWSRAAFGEKDAFDSCAICDAKKSAEVLWVFNAIDREDEARGFAGGRFIGRGIGLEKVLDGEEFLRADERDYALMCGCISSEGELLARFLADPNACVATLGDDPVKTVVVALARDEHVVKAAAAGLESFRHRMQAVENFHEISLVR